MSFYEMSINNSVKVKQKSSGVTICTGTGSSSWYFNINYISKTSVKELFKIGRHRKGVPHAYKLKRSKYNTLQETRLCDIFPNLIHLL